MRSVSDLESSIVSVEKVDEYVQVSVVLAEISYGSREITSASMRNVKFG